VGGTTKPEENSDDTQKVEAGGRSEMLPLKAAAVNRQHPAVDSQTVRLETELLAKSSVSDF
jgi:hypothetical protein